MKILYVIDTNPLNGGAPISSCAIASEQSMIGNEIKMILPNVNNDIPLPKNVNFKMIESFSNNFPSPLFNPVQFFKLIVEIRKIVKAELPNIVHAQMPRGALALGVLKKFKLIPKNIKMVYSDREQMEKYKWPLRLLAHIFILKVYDVVICLTSISSNLLSKSEGLAQLEVIPNSAGRVYENYDNNQKYYLQKKYNIPKDNFVVMFAGRMTKDKNWPLALEIIKKISQKGVFVIAIIGASTEEKIKHAKAFSEEVKSLTEGRCLILINVSPSEMPDYYYLADLFIMTSDKEAFGRTAIEAMSRRCVVIGRNIGGIPEVINKNENLLNRSSVEFYNRIMEYRLDTDQLERDKEWFFTRFKTNYTTAANTDKHEQIYNELADVSLPKKI